MLPPAQGLDVAHGGAPGGQFGCWHGKVFGAGGVGGHGGGPWPGALGVLARVGAMTQMRLDCWGYAWVNDHGTMRKAGSSSNPYAVFSDMLNSGNPPGE